MVYFLDAYNSAMFHKWPKMIVFVLMVLFMHMFTGQHSHASALVLCVGNDGHIAIEAVQHEDHSTQIADVSEHLEICSDAGKCRDISLSLGHPDLLNSGVSQDIFCQLHKASLNITDTELYDITLPVFRHPVVSDLTISFRHRPCTAQTQTLKHTILLI